MGFVNEVYLHLDLMCSITEVILDLSLNLRHLDTITPRGQIYKIPCYIVSKRTRSDEWDAL